MGSHPVDLWSNKDRYKSLTKGRRNSIMATLLLIMYFSGTFTLLIKERSDTYIFLF